jgi:hypothetical protein
VTTEALIIEAIRGKWLIAFNYGGLPRLVEPHALGAADDGSLVLSAWQVGGGSRSAAGDGWRTFRLEEMQQLQRLEVSFAGPRVGYNPAALRFARVLFSLSAARPVTDA